MRNSTRGLLLVASLVLAGSAFAAPAGGIVEHPPVQQGYGTGPYGGYGPVGPATSPAVVVPYLAPNGITVYPLSQSNNTVKPGPNSTVKVNYRGWLANGTEFDSSYSRGQPANRSGRQQGETGLPAIDGLRGQPGRQYSAQQHADL